MAHDRIHALSVPRNGGRAREQTLYARLPLPALSPPYQKSNSSLRGSRIATQFGCTSSNSYSLGSGRSSRGISTAVSSEARAKLREWAVLASKGRLLLSGSVVLASLKAAVMTPYGAIHK